MRWWHRFCLWQPSRCQGFQEGSSPVSPHRSPPSHPPVTPFPQLPSTKLSLPTPPSFFLPTARLLLYPHFFLHSNSEICFFLGVRPLHQHPPLVSPTLLLAFFWLLTPSDSVLGLLFVQLSIPLRPCLFCVQSCLPCLNPCLPLSQLASYSLVGCVCLFTSPLCLSTSHSQKLLGKQCLEPPSSL